MAWKLIKSILSFMCFLLAVFIIVTASFDLMALSFAVFLMCLSALMWVDFSEPISKQRLSKHQKIILQIAIIIFISSILVAAVHGWYTNEQHINVRGLFKAIAALFKFL